MTERSSKRKAKLKRELKKEQGNSCFYCKRIMNNEDAASELYATLEHRIPKSRGGNFHKNNIVFSCRACNEAKRNYTEKEFLSLVNLLGFEKVWKMSGFETARFLQFLFYGFQKSPHSFVFYNLKNSENRKIFPKGYYLQH